MRVAEGRTAEGKRAVAGEGTGKQTPTGAAGAATNLSVSPAEVGRSSSVPFRGSCSSLFVQPNGRTVSG